MATDTTRHGNPKAVKDTKQGKPKPIKPKLETTDLKRTVKR